MPNSRTRVIIRCRRCGERFTLRGKKEKGRVNTGFKQCLCSNDRDFDVHVEEP